MYRKVSQKYFYKSTHAAMLIFWEKISLLVRSKRNRLGPTNKMVSFSSLDFSTIKKEKIWRKLERERERNAFNKFQIEMNANFPIFPLSLFWIEILQKPLGNRKVKQISVYKINNFYPKNIVDYRNICIRPLAWILFKCKLHTGAFHTNKSGTVCQLTCFNRFTTINITDLDTNMEFVF